MKFNFSPLQDNLILGSQGATSPSDQVPAFLKKTGDFPGYIRNLGPNQGGEFAIFLAIATMPKQARSLTRRKQPSHPATKPHFLLGQTPSSLTQNGTALGLSGRLWPVARQTEST